MISAVTLICTGVTGAVFIFMDKPYLDSLDLLFLAAVFTTVAVQVKQDIHERPFEAGLEEHQPDINGLTANEKIFLAPMTWWKLSAALALLSYVTLVLSEFLTSKSEATLTKTFYQSSVLVQFLCVVT